jgi:hypothetical protein
VTLECGWVNSESIPGTPDTPQIAWGYRRVATFREAVRHYEDGRRRNGRLGRFVVWDGARLVCWWIGREEQGR